MKEGLITISDKADKSSWQNISSKSKELFTANNIIDAYQKGKEEGMNHMHSKIKRQLTDNLAAVLPKIEKFYKDIPEKAKEFMMLRISSMNYFQVIVALDKNTYFDDKECQPIYRSSSDLCRKLNNVSISFI